MLHIFKINGHRAAYDCANREYYSLSSLAMKIIDEVTPPLSPECPSALRYALAKYDSHDLADAYAEVYNLYAKGLLFANNAAVSAVSPDLYAVVNTSAEAAVGKISSAVSAGFSKLIVLVTGATVCLASTLREIFAGKAELKLVFDLADAALSESDIAALNAAECYIRIPVSEKFSSDVLALADRGALRIDADIPATEQGKKELAKLAKEIEKRGKDFSFAPFDFALLSKEGYDLNKTACADCWARELCGGYYLSGQNDRTPMCDIACTAIECAVTLASEN